MYVWHDIVKYIFIIYDDLNVMFVRDWPHYFVRFVAMRNRNRGLGNEFLLNNGLFCDYHAVGISGFMLNSFFYRVLVRREDC